MNLNTPFVGKNHQHFQSIESTHEYMNQCLSKTNPSEGFCVSSDFQSGGRGQIGRNWHSEAKKNILVSYVFYPAFLTPSHSFYLNMWTALALVDVLIHFGVKKISIKWPNDIYVDQKKVAGILIQNTLRGESIKNCIVSVGLNVNQVEFPISLPNPTSIMLEKEEEILLEVVFQKINDFLEKRYLNLKTDIDEKKIQHEYNTFLFGKDKYYNYQKEDGTFFKAKVHEVKDDGRFILKNEDGLPESFLFRQISLVV